MTEDGKPLADDNGPERREEPPTTPEGIPQQPGEGTGARGHMRYQEPGSTTPREPTLAEKKARERAEQRRAEQAAAQLAEAEKKTQVRRRVMIGGGATVGVVALVAAFYTGTAYSAERDRMLATCTGDDNGRVVAQPDEYCDENYVRSHGHYDSHSGLWLMPLFLGGGRFGGDSQYRYSYSPSGTATASPGQTVSNPNFTKPDASTKVTTKSGTTIQRGGFGLGSKSGSSGS
jgi:hypothetical protein